MFLEREGVHFEYHVLPDNNDRFAENEEANTDMVTGTIYIKESVMVQACKKSSSRAFFTILHELGHYFLHFLKADENLIEVEDSAKVKLYCDPEWQADTFTSEFLMPYEECLKLTSLEISRVYKVSKKAADIRYKKIHE